MIHHGRNQAGDLELSCDVVIVGSGSGGAVVAAHLAEAGLDTIILEEGGHVRPEEYGRMRPSEHLRHLWRDAGMTMAVGRGDTPMINVMMGRCVGGSSLLTGGVCFRIPEEVLHEWKHSRGLEGFEPADLEPYYADVESNVHIKEVPVEMQSRSTRLFAEGAEKLGYSVRPMRRNTKDCVGWSTCNFGCPKGAKMSVDVTYLPRAMAAGAQLYSDCLVERVMIDGGKAAGISGRVLNAPYGQPGGRLTVKARRVVLAAGAIHTPLIMAKSGIGKKSRQVGRNLTLHPAFRILARFDDPVNGSQGALQSAYSDDFHSEGIQLNSVFVPGGILAATMPGVGRRHRERVKNIPNLAMFGCNLHDEGGGRVLRGLGREPWITYRMAKKDRAAIPRALKIAGDTFFAAGAREVFLPVLGLDGLDADAFARFDLSSVPANRLECTSQHPLGTCRMGISRDTSVVNPDGESWDVEGLYVADGSAVPTSLAVNPQLTIMTLATRFSWRLRERL